MEAKELKIKKENKKIEPLDYIFLGIIFVFIVIIIGVFFHSTSFIVSNINNIFETKNITTNQNLEIKRYSQIERKLNLSGNTQDNINIEKKQNFNTQTNETNTLSNKKLLKINIINTSTKDGAASILSKDLESNGFSKSTTESKKIVSSTIVSIKESKKEYSELIKQVVEKTYPKISTIVNPENGEYDVVVIIGK